MLHDYPSLDSLSQSRVETGLTLAGLGDGLTGEKGLGGSLTQCHRETGSMCPSLQPKSDRSRTRNSGPSRAQSIVHLRTGQSGPGDCRTGSDWTRMQLSVIWLRVEDYATTLTRVSVFDRGQSAPKQEKCLSYPDLHPHRISWPQVASFLQPEFECHLFVFIICERE